MSIIHVIVSAALCPHAYVSGMCRLFVAANTQSNWHSFSVNIHIHMQTQYIAMKVEGFLTLPLGFFLEQYLPPGKIEALHNY